MHHVICYKFRVHNEILNILSFNRLLNKVNDIWILRSHPLQVSRVNLNCVGASIEMYLPSEPIVFILTRECQSLKPIQDLTDALCGFGEHGLHGDAHSNVAPLLQSGGVIAYIEEGVDYLSVVRKFADCLVYVVLNLLTLLGKLGFTNYFFHV